MLYKLPTSKKQKQKPKKGKHTVGGDEVETLFLELTFRNFPKSPIILSAFRRNESAVGCRPKIQDPEIPSISSRIRSRERARVRRSTWVSRAAWEAPRQRPKSSSRSRPSPTSFLLPGCSARRRGARISRLRPAVVARLRPRPVAAAVAIDVAHVQTKSPFLLVFWFMFVYSASTPLRSGNDSVLFRDSFRVFCCSS